MIWTQEAYINALQFAAEAHGDQKVPGKNWSYIYHVTLVAMELLAVLTVEKDLRGDLMLQCALLHDVIEDTDTRSEQLGHHFNAEVVAGIEALTKNKTISGEYRMRECLERIIAQPKEVWMVKMADRITNLQEPPSSWGGDKISHYYNESLLIYDTLRKASEYLARRLALKMKQYRTFIP